MTGYVGDVLSLETYDGKRLDFPSDDIRLLAYGDFGIPATNWITRRGYKQHGETEIDFLMQTRQLDLTLWNAPACDRQAYWDMRYALHEILRPNRNGPMTLTLMQPGGEQRALTVRADPGLTFPPDDNNNWAINAPISLLAFDPIWFDPDQTDTDYAMTESTDTDLVFPITFPIVFGVSGLIFTTGVITYQGSWKTYPTITLTGPYTSASITNTATGVVISMTVPISAGDTRIIDLTPGGQRIIDGAGISRYNELGSGSNLIGFNIRPDPEVANGIQTIEVIMFNGVSGQSGARISYYDRYVAL